MLQDGSSLDNNDDDSSRSEESAGETEDTYSDEDHSEPDDVDLGMMTARGKPQSRPKISPDPLNPSGSTLAEQLEDKEKPAAIPSFVVSDNSKIDVISISNSFFESMAKNHLDSSSLEASM